MVPMRAWKLEQAQDNLCELVAKAASEGPQSITLDGAEAAVVLSAREYELMSKRPKTVVEALLDPKIRLLSDEEHDRVFARLPDVPERLFEFEE